MEKIFEEAKTSTTIKKKMDRLRNKSIRKNLLSYVNLWFHGKG